MNEKPEIIECDNGLRWLRGNIRRKLTLFVVVILIMVIGLFWFFSVYMLQPTYQRSIRADVAVQLAVVTSVLDGAMADGVPLLVLEADESGVLQTRASDEVIALLNGALKEGRLVLTGRCLEIADRRLHSVLRVDNLVPGCLLHLSYEAGIGPDGVKVSSEDNGEFVTLVRQEVFRSGSYESVPGKPVWR